MTVIFQCHYRVNLPGSVALKVGSPVGLIRGSVVNVEKRLTRDGDDSRFSDLQLSAGSHAKRELCVRPTENNFAKLTPFFVWFCRYLSHNDPWLVAGRILKRDVKIPVRLNFESNDARTCHVQVFHDAEHPSTVELPLR